MSEMQGRIKENHWLTDMKLLILHHDNFNGNTSLVVPTNIKKNHKDH